MNKNWAYNSRNNKVDGKVTVLREAKVFNCISVFRSGAYFRASPKFCCQRDKTGSFSAKVTTDPPPAPSSLEDKLCPLTFARIMNRNASLAADLLICSCFIPSAETPRSRALCQLYATFPYEENSDWIIYLDLPHVDPLSAFLRVLDSLYYFLTLKYKESIISDR